MIRDNTEYNKRMNNHSSITVADKVNIIAEALPYIQRYHGKTIVIKYGGNAMTDEALQTAFAGDVALLKLVGINPVLVHGGGPQINDVINRMGLKTHFVEGMRYTDKDIMNIVEMVLGGLVNKQIVQTLNNAGARAVGLTGKDGGLLQARRMKVISGRKKIDVGLVGNIESVNPNILSLLYNANFIPVIAPIAIGDKGETLNVNADIAAARLAIALAAQTLFFLTNTAGVLNNKGQMLSEIKAQTARAMIKSGAIKGGMKPKVEYALTAVSGGVPSCRIIDGTVRHALLLEIFTDKGAGTQIIK